LTPQLGLDGGPPKQGAQ
jgi:hypothetical protein